MKLYLTVFEADHGRAQPVGYVTEVDKYGSTHGVNDESNGISHEACVDCQEDRETLARLTLLTEYVMGLGYEVSFTSEPHTDPDAVHQSRRPNVPSEGYEEVS